MPLIFHRFLSSSLKSTKLTSHLSPVSSLLFLPISFTSAAGSPSLYLLHRAISSSPNPPTPNPIAGNCEMSVPLYNSIIRFCCGRKLLFNRAFDAYKKMLNSHNCKPTLETFTLLYSSLLRRFNKLNVCYVYLHSVRSLTKQMKSLGVIPDTYVLNMIIKAYSKCLQVDEAIKVFREMGLYGCEPNAFTYGYIAKGLCEKGRVEQGFGFYREMKEKGLVPSGSCYVILICSLVMERSFDDAIELVFDMLGNSMGPDMLTYKTLLEGLCREERVSEAFELLEEFRRRDVVMGDRNYKTLLNGLHFINQE